MVRASFYAAFAIALAAPGRVGAAVLIYQFGDVVAGSPPEGASPWLTTAFSDVSPGVVQLTVSAAGMTTAESLGSLLLNFDPADNPANLTFTSVGGVGSFAQPTISTGENRFKANGGGKYDIDFAFSKKAGKIFTAGDSLTFDITSAVYGTGLDALDFDYLSTPTAGGAGPFLAAAQIDCTSGTTTEEIAPVGMATVPEPDTFGFLAAGGALVIAALWPKFRRDRATSTR
jgi:hypothetical protein